MTEQEHKCSRCGTVLEKRTRSLYLIFWWCPTCKRLIAALELIMAKEKKKRCQE